MFPDSYELEENDPKVYLTKINSIEDDISDIVFAEYDPKIRELTKKCNKLEKTIEILLDFLPDDIKTGVKLALELDDKNEKM